MKKQTSGRCFLETFFNNNKDETVKRPDVFMVNEETEVAVPDTSFLTKNFTKVGNAHDSSVGVKSNKLDGVKGTPTRTELDSHEFAATISLHQELDCTNADLEEVPHQRSAGDGFDSLQSYGDRGSAQVEELFSNEEFCSLNETFEEALVFLRDRLQIQYDRLRKEMQSSLRNIVLQEMQKILTTAQQLRDQVLSLREVVKTQERMIARKDQVVDDLMTDLRRANENAEARITENMLKTEKLVERFIDNWWSRRLLQRAFIAWKRYLGGTWKIRFLQRMRSEAYAECDRLRRDNENTTKHLENELKLAKSEMETLRASHAEESATLKMALMRGVCALNLETLGFFNKNTSLYLAEARPWSDSKLTYCNSNNVYQVGDAEYQIQAFSSLTDSKSPSCTTAIGQAATPTNSVTRICDTAEHWPRNPSLIGDAVHYSCREAEKPIGCPSLTRFSVLTDRPPQTNSRIELQTASSAPLDRVERLNLTALTDTSQVRPSFSRTQQSQSLVKEFSVPARHTFTHRAHTVQLGAPAGPSTYSSSVAASVQVHRHEPLSKVAVYDKMKTNYAYEYCPKANSKLEPAHLETLPGPSYIRA